MERAATKKISRAAALGRGRGARSKSESRRFGERSCGIEAMLDRLEIRRDKQLRRRRRESARRQKNRRTDRAIIVIVCRNLRRRMRFGVGKRGVLCACRVRVLRYGVQMDVTEGDHDLQRQRDQRQHRTAPSMATNRTHSPTRPRRAPTRCRTLTLLCYITQGPAHRVQPAVYFASAR
jgi:hypothetical protein